MNTRRMGRFGGDHMRFVLFLSVKHASYCDAFKRAVHCKGHNPALSNGPNKSKNHASVYIPRTHTITKTNSNALQCVSPNSACT